MNSSFLPSKVLPIVEPASAPSTPAPAYMAPQRHFTVFARAWVASPDAALVATASAEVPMATCGLDTPTR